MAVIHRLLTCLFLWIGISQILTLTIYWWQSRSKASFPIPYDFGTHIVDLFWESVTARTRCQVCVRSLLGKLHTLVLILAASCLPNHTLSPNNSTRLWCKNIPRKRTASGTRHLATISPINKSRCVPMRFWSSPAERHHRIFTFKTVSSWSFFKKN